MSIVSVYMSPKVTVITPTYNRSAFLKIAMRSVLDCGYENLQYLIIDDASTDDTAQIVHELQQKYPNIITYIRNEKNLRESGSINVGWKEAQGKYVAILSDDDFFLPNWFEQSVTFMEQNSHIIAGYPDWNKVDQNGKVVRTIYMEEYNFSRLFTTCANMPGPGVIIRKSFLEDKKHLREEKYIYAADYEMWLILATRAPFAHIPHITCCWRQHEQSLTCKPDINNKITELELAINKFVEDYKDSTLISKNRKKLQVRTYLHIAYISCRNKSFILAGKYGLRAFMKSPYWVCRLAWCYVSRIISSYK